MDLSSDAGIVGRVTVDKKEREVKLDLKGQIYTGKFQPCNSFALVEVTQATGQAEAEARVVSIANRVLVATWQEGMKNEDVLEGGMDEKQDHFDGSADVTSVPQRRRAQSKAKNKKNTKSSTSKKRQRTG
eukprot:UC1_evm3s1749